jgi:hypothetical protein
MSTSPAGTLLVLALALPGAFAGTTLLPIDGAPKDPGFLAFRTDLVAALERHDADAVLAVVDSGINNGFGGEDGIAEFESIWKPRDPESRLWKQFGAVLALGGAFQPDGGFTAPYVFTRWPDSIDAFTHVAIVGTNVAARATPSPKGALVGRLTYAIVARADDLSKDQDPDWTRVRLGKRIAYVASRYARSPVDYRAHFERKAGRWRLTVLVSGD